MNGPSAFLLLVASFATLLTAHVAIAWGLAWRAPRWRSPVALVIAPLAVYWAIRERMFVRAAAWVLGAAAYVVLRRAA